MPLTLSMSYQALSTWVAFPKRKMRFNRILRRWLLRAAANQEERPAQRRATLHVHLPELVARRRVRVCHNGVVRPRLLQYLVSKHIA